MAIPDILRALLGLAILSMAILSFFYLSRRNLSWKEYLFLGLISAFIPIFGPFLVLSMHPGSPRTNRRKLPFA